MVTLRRLVVLVVAMVAGSAFAATDSVEVYKTTHFAVYWLNTGVHAPVGRDQDGNGRPDYVDSAAFHLERGYKVLSDSLKYRKPQGQKTTLYTQRAVPDGLYPVEILDIAQANPYFRGNRVYGQIFDSSESVDGKGGSLIWLENDFLDGGKDSIRVVIRGVAYRNWVKEPFEGLKAAVAHELYHAFTYEYDWQAKTSFHEMTAVWFESWFAPETQNHWQYLPRFRDNLWRGVWDNSNQQSYGNYLFIRAMVDLYGTDVVRKLWEERIGASGIFVDLEWFDMAWPRIKVDTISNLTDYYGLNAVKLITGQSSKFDEDGALTGKINPVFDSVFIRKQDTTIQRAYGLLGGRYGIDNLRIRFSAAPDTVMRIAIECSWPDSAGKMYVVHFPSKETEIIQPSTKVHVTGYRDSDTLIVAFAVGSNNATGWGVYGTSQAVGVSRRSSMRIPQYTQTRDIFGRPVSKSGSTQIRIETAPSQGSRSRVSW